MSYYMQPTREYRTPGSTLIEMRGCGEGDEPELFSVYFRGTDGTSTWIADFINEDDAKHFLSFKALTS